MGPPGRGGDDLAGRGAPLPGPGSVLKTTVDDVAAAFRAEYGRAVAVLVRSLGDIALAEDAVADAFEKAVRTWPVDGVPPSPAGWIITSARNRAIDHLRREAVRDRKHEEAVVPIVDTDDEEHAEIPDERLSLMFTCCHPALAAQAQVALTLKLLGGLTTGEIARAFVVSESTLAQRIVRAKNKIRDARIPYRVPEAAELPARLDGVLTTLYLVFNEGYVATAGYALTRADLCAEAIRLARVLVRLVPDEPEAAGLLALMLLSEARRPARTDADGALVRLADQDRSQWRSDLVAEGRDIVRACLRHNRPGRFQLQAAIQAAHTDPVTDWAQIVELYALLEQFDASPVVTLNRAVAVAELDGPLVALRLLDGLTLEDYQPFHAVRADLLARAGDSKAAVAAYDRARALTTNPVERTHLDQRRTAVSGVTEERC